MIKHPQDREQRLRIKKLKHEAKQQKEKTGGIRRKREALRQQETEDELKHASSSGLEAEYR